MNPFGQQPSDWITVLGLTWLLNNKISAIMANNENVRVASFQIVDGQLVWVQTEKAIEEHQSYTKVWNNNLGYIKSSEFEFNESTCWHKQNYRSFHFQNADAVSSVFLILMIVFVLITSTILIGTIASSLSLRR